MVCVYSTGFRLWFSNPLHYQNENEESEITASLLTDEKNSDAEANFESVEYVSDTLDIGKFSILGQFCYNLI